MAGPVEDARAAFDRGDYATVARLRLVGEIFAAAVERKRVEAALRKSEEEFRQMAENIREVFWLATADLGKMLYISPAYEAVWGQSRESLYREPPSFLRSRRDRRTTRTTRCPCHASPP